MRRRGNLIIISLVLALLIGSAWTVATTGAVLGLDLQGGAQAVLQVTPDKGTKITPDLMASVVDELRGRVDKLGVAEPEIQREGNDRVSVALPGAKDPNDLFSIIGSTGKLYFLPLESSLTQGVSSSVIKGQGIVVKNSLWELLQAAQALPNAKAGNFSGYYGFTKSGVGKKAVYTPVADQAFSSKDELDKYLLAKGIDPATVTVVGVPEGTLPMYCSSWGSVPCPGATFGGTDTNKAKPEQQAWYLMDLPAKDQQLTGALLSSAQATVDPQTGQPIVQMTFNDQGAKLFENITKQLAHDGRTAWEAAGSPSSTLQYQKQFAVILDNRLQTFPTIDFQANPNGISGNSSIITGLTAGEAQKISVVLKSGSLPVTLTPLSTSEVSATLGKQSLDQSIVAAAVGLAIVAIYMLIFYRFLGLIADIALLIYALLYYGLILAIPVTLTLPGIAGAILTIGVAADANVVIFERIKEEVRSGRSVKVAINQGYKKGFSTIVDANVVTLITAAVLFIASQASVKGFALLLALGVLVSMFTAVAATRALLGLLGGFAWFNDAAFMGATAKPVRWRMDFIGRRKLLFSISGVVVLIAVLSLGFRGLNQGIDFTGGTRVDITTAKPETVQQVQNALAPIDPKLRNATVRGVSGVATGNRSTSSSFTEFEIDSKELSVATIRDLAPSLTQNGVPATVKSSQTVSASFGKTILQGAIIAFIGSLALIALYLAVRFDWKYAVPTMVALLHDLVITIGIYSLTGREVTASTVAAVLTILGYSLYDTIIVFDRVRDNERHLRRHTYAQIVNISLWETLTRSLNTSMITLLPILSLLVFGGATLKDFAFALLIGIVSGAYSSFGIAAPILAILKGREPEYKRRAGSDELPYAMIGAAPAAATGPAPARRLQPPPAKTEAAAPEAAEGAVAVAEYEGGEAVEPVLEDDGTPAPGADPDQVRPVEPGEDELRAREEARQRRELRKKRR